ncbi:glycoside hydrolase family 15 protein [Costertonia aggregata]|uniref:Glycoside hydrolase family 15 protein n=1 Tax=Costertonia aggregata TaxID=343403 RepID=A0A7H9ASY5_9FLAO|nr:glycoside hydrolase family 15 protein [Costertonia aggregata]QLG46559.1 glycoside hydrolase family 15 protein [Costertonia aggregata]
MLDTNVLLTRFFSKDHTIDIIDFMPISNDGERQNQIIRIVKPIRGDATFSFDLDIRPEYGQAQCKPININGKFFYCKIDETNNEFGFSSNLKLFKKSDEFIASFSLEESQVAIFILGNTKNLQDNLNDYASSQLEATVKYWRNWIKACQYEGAFADSVRRSALTLKLLTSSEYGATVAAATFSLPEKIGGTRNYDYRFTWIRDAAFSMYAFMRMGFFDEAKDFMRWIHNCIEDNLNGDIDLQIMYRVDGTRDLTEKEVNLEGYANSKPVRIGNKATEQLQLDIFGELMDTIYLFDKYGEPITFSFWEHIEQLLEFVCKNWNSADHGIWEVRETKRHYLYTRVMCWVALDRAIKLVRKRSFPTDLERWIKNRNLIHKDIYDNFWNEELDSSVHFKDAQTVDSSLLIMPLVQFISPYDSKWLKTLKVIEDQLKTDVLMYRNMDDEILVKSRETEGTFLVGAFWYVECLARGGQLEKATHYFQKLLGYGNHLGLFAEEMDESGRHLGNFPQAFTHLGLISAAFNLHRQKHKANYTIEDSYDLF